MHVFGVATINSRLSVPFVLQEHNHQLLRKDCHACRDIRKQENTTRLKSEHIHAAEGTLAFHCVKHHNSYKSMNCNSGLIMKIFMTQKQRRNLQVCAQKLKHLY